MAVHCFALLFGPMNPTIFLTSQKFGHFLIASSFEILFILKLRQMVATTPPVSTSKHYSFFSRLLLCLYLSFSCHEVNILEYLLSASCTVKVDSHSLHSMALAFFQWPWSWRKLIESILLPPVRCSYDFILSLPHKHFWTWCTLVFDLPESFFS